MIYVLRSTNGLKVGHTTNLKRRLRNLRTADPSLVLLFSFPGDRLTEKAIHQALQSDRKDGEFFRDNPAVIERLLYFSNYYTNTLMEV